MHRKLLFAVLFTCALLANFAVAWADPPAAGACADGIPCISNYKPGTGANDSKTDNPTCDGDLMNQMYSRAYMESERQLVTAQSVIKKPDSVLQYTCFDQYASVAAKKAGAIFSDSEDWHNKIVDISAGDHSGFLGKDFLDKISNFAKDLISKLLTGLLPENLLNVLSHLDTLMNLDPSRLIQSLSNLGNVDLSNMLGNLSIDMQIQIKSQLLGNVPPQILGLISSNPNGATAEQLLLGLQNLPPNAVESVMSSMNPAQIANLVNTLPSTTLSQLSPVALNNALHNMTPTQLSSVLGQMSPQTLANLPPNVLSNTLSTLSSRDLTTVLRGMNPSALTGVLSSLSPDELNGVMANLPGRTQNLLRNEIANFLPPGVTSLLGNPLSMNLQDLLGGIQGLDPADLANLIPSLSLDQFQGFLGVLNVDQLGSLLGGGVDNVHIKINVFMGADHLDKAIENVVLSSMKDYTDSNFGAGFLGGTAGFGGDTSDKVSTGDYSCTAMQDVWQVSKCNNFGENGDPGFQTFQQLATSDPRQHPQACGGTMIVKEMQDVANNKDGAYVKTSPLEKTYIERLGTAPDGTIACGDPVAIPEKFVTRKTYTMDLEGNVKTKTVQYPEKVCSNPACTYNQAEDSCIQK